MPIKNFKTLTAAKDYGEPYNADSNNTTAATAKDWAAIRHPAPVMIFRV